MSETDGKPLRDRIAALELGPAEQRLADQLLNIPALELGAMTSSDLSQRSGTSRSSIDRLSRRLGYPGLKEMRKALMLEARRGDEAQAAVQDGSTLSGDIARRVMGGVAARAAAMAATLAGGPELDGTVDLLLAARQIPPVRRRRVGCSVQRTLHAPRAARLPIAFTDEFHTQVTLAALMRPGDLAVAISYSGGTRSTLWPADLAKTGGAQLVVITGVPTSPLARMADLTMLLPTGRGLPGSAEVLDRVVVAALAEVLFECIVVRDPDRLAHSVRIDDTFDAARASL